MDAAIYEEQFCKTNLPLNIIKIIAHEQNEKVR